MPQLAQLSLVYASQWFWLLITLGAIYFFVGHGIVPKVEKTVDDREAQIAADLAAADAARSAADATEASYRERMDAARAEAAKLTGKAKDDSARTTEKKLAKADAAIGAKLAKAEDKIAAARSAAVKDIENLAAELAREITGKVAGIEVSAAESANAVKAVMTHV